MVNKVAQRAIAAGLAGMMSFGAVAPAAMALDTHTWSSWWNWSDTSSDEGLKYFRRIAGDDRYGTMKKIVEASYKISGDYWWNASVAVVASGDNFPDALAANGLAGALNNGDGAPVILTKKGSLSSQAKELLQKMSVQTVYIMGGTAAVSEATEQAIKDLKIATVRVAGADRQATSVAAFKLIDGNWYKNRGTHSVIIATGANYADALSIAPFAYRTGTPVVLTKADGTLTDEAIKAIKDNDQIYQCIVVGGTAAVSDSVFGALGTYNGSYKDYYNKVYIPVRIAGADRYDTSAKIADWEVKYALDIQGMPNDKTNYFNYAGFSFNETFVATGENFPDALAGGQLAGGKYYANSSYKVNATRWNGGGTYTIGSIKDASPILLTKDGNRAADSVIASNLAWNTTKRSVDAYEFCNASLADYLDDYLTLGAISSDIRANDAYGFFTAYALDWINGTPSTTTSTTTSGSTTTTTTTTKTSTVTWDATTCPVAWLDGYRVVDNNFKGIIFGGKAAVSKDKAKQLDETVDDSIYKINDSVAAISDDSYITIAGRTYRTLGWLYNNPTTWYTYLGVSGLGDPSVANPAWKDVFNANEVIAVPYGSYGYQYLYQPIGKPVISNTTFSTTNSDIQYQTVTIDLAEFSSAAAYASIGDNAYTGYGFTGVGTLTIDYTYKYNTSGALVLDTATATFNVTRY